MARKPHHPICPKCGYDQSGAISTWEDRCPLDGVCPECGLAFEWAEVFRPLIRDLHWYTEHAGSIRSLIWRTPGTLARLMLPHLFWRQLDVKKRVSIPILIVWCLLLCIVTHLLVAIPVGLEYWNQQNWMAQPLDLYVNQYGLSAIAAILFNGIAQPLYEADANVSVYLVNISVQRDWWGRDHLMQTFFRPIGFQLGFIVLWLTVLLAIPHTRRLTKLRGVHIARVAVISTTAMVLTFELYRLNVALNGLGGYKIGVTSVLYKWIIPMMIVWQIVFWASAVRSGWGIRPWRLLVMLGTLAALLGGATLRVYVFLSTTA